MWSKRTLVYVEPKVDPARVLQNVQRDKTGQVTVNTSQETDNYVAKQVKYTVEDFHHVVKDMRLADLLGQVGVLQLTAKKDDAEVSLARDEDAQRGVLQRVVFVDAAGAQCECGSAACRLLEGVPRRV